MSSLKIPSIPVPGDDVKSLQASVQSLKEAVELMAGMRGDSPFMLTNDQGKLYSKRVSQIEKSPASAWEVAFNQTVLNTTGFNVYNLGKYRALRMILYIGVPTSTAAGIWPYMRVGNSTTFVGAAGAYVNNLLYTAESGTAITQWTNYSDTVFHLALANNISNNVYGCRVEATLCDWNKNVQTVAFINGTYFNGTNLVQYTGTIREAGGAARDSLHFAFNGDATPMNVFLYIEGLVG